MLCVFRWLRVCAVAALAAGVTAEPVRAEGPAGLSKVRRGSLLKAKKQSSSVDLRGTWERLRDFAIAKHYERMALLQVAMDLAVDLNDAALQEHVGSLERLAQRRFQELMLRLRRATRKRVVLGIEEGSPYLVVGSASPEEILAAPKPNAVFKDAVEKARAQVSEREVRTVVATLERELMQERERS